MRRARAAADADQCQGIQSAETREVAALVLETNEWQDVDVVPAAPRAVLHAGRGDRDLLPEMRSPSFKPKRLRISSEQAWHSVMKW